MRSTVAAAESRAASAASTVDCGVLPPAISVFCALERRLGVLELGEAVGEIRLLDRIVEVDQRRAGFDVVARLEMDRR